MKKTRLIVVTVLAFSSLSNLSWPYQGDGTAENPFQISTVNDWLTLINTSADWNKSFVVTADLDFQGAVLTPIAPDTNPGSTGFQGTAFSGVLNGDNHTFQNFVIDQPSADYVGLFGQTSSAAAIRNLHIRSFVIKGRNYVGSLLGENQGSITLCSAEGFVQGQNYIGGLTGHNYYGLTNFCRTNSIFVKGTAYVGGLAGKNYSNAANPSNRYGAILFCHSTGQIEGLGIAGGLVGMNEGLIYNCWADTIIPASADGVKIGGLIGENYSIVRSCFAAGSVIAGVKSGGFIGTNFGLVANCYSTSSISGTSRIGGFIGHNTGPLSFCYSTGLVIGSQETGGLIGFCFYNNASSCFWDIQTSGQTISADGIGKTTAQMKTLSTFTSAGWDFTNETANGTDDIWRMCTDGVDYPRLNWERTRGDFACPDGVYLEDLTFINDRWLMSGCSSSNNFCGGADLNSSGLVDLADWAVFAQNWLREI
ncbi:MAG TPA: hypothetical protein PK054_01675 [Anaerohalosphaeraceae bacterium]|nr:hypothetical protein [Anaerohalosphaeraceae bacterium]HOL88022.1 hypothetical protein [Anaerohalosphaeraceae bacterium]HPP55270.1 hypothetical protein [Anaerohalosphaeraceae bacterium]